VRVYAPAFWRLAKLLVESRTRTRSRASATPSEISPAPRPRGALRLIPMKTAARVACRAAIACTNRPTRSKRSNEGDPRAGFRGRKQIPRLAFHQRHGSSMAPFVTISIAAERDCRSDARHTNFFSLPPRHLSEITVLLLLYRA
jgi:hypothetical protein